MMAIAPKMTTPWITGRSKRPIDSSAVPSEPGEPEDGLDEDRASEREADVHPEHRDDGEHRVPQHVLADHPVLGRALGASGADEVLVSVSITSARIKRT